MSMADPRRFRATCPRCGQLATFLAARIEKAVLTQEQLAAGERPGLGGFRCLACRAFVVEADDVEGYEHRWVGDEPVTYPIETGVPDQGGR